MRQRTVVVLLAVIVAVVAISYAAGGLVSPA
jgi:hypothetical protein